MEKRKVKTKGTWWEVLDKEPPQHRNIDVEVVLDYEDETLYIEGLIERKCLAIELVDIARAIALEPE